MVTKWISLIKRLSTLLQFQIKRSPWAAILWCLCIYLLLFIRKEKRKTRCSTLQLIAQKLQNHLLRQEHINLQYFLYLQILNDRLNKTNFKRCKHIIDNFPQECLSSIDTKFFPPGWSDIRATTKTVFYSVYFLKWIVWFQAVRVILRWV